MDSLRNSFKKSPRRNQPESIPILSDHDDMKTPEENRDIELGGDVNGGKIWREGSYDFLGDAGKVVVTRVEDNSNGGEDSFDFQQGQKKVIGVIKEGKEGEEEDDPPSKLIGQFLHKQKLSGEICLDMDLEMEELDENHVLNLPTISESPTNQQQISPKGLKVSFGRSSQEQEIVSEIVRRKSKESSAEQGGGDYSGDKGEVLRCTSRPTSTFLRTKTTKSRLMDTPLEEQQDKKSGKTTGRSGILRSGFLGKSSVEEDEEDPFADEDLPDEFKKAKFNTSTVFQWVCLFLLVGACVCFLAIPVLAKRVLWHLPLWKWGLFVLVLICGRLFSGWAIRIVVFLIERNFLLRKRVLYFVYGVRKAVQNSLWVGLVLLAWHFIFRDKERTDNVHRYLNTVTHIVVCLLITTIIWLVKTLLLKILASSFHVSTYFDRLQEALFNQYVIETLSGPPLMEIKKAVEEEEKVMAEVQNLQNAGANMPADLRATAFPNTKSGRVVGSGLQQRSPREKKSFRISGALSEQKDEGITIDQLHKLNQKNISAWNMKRMMNIVRHGALYTLDERIQNSNEEDEAAMEIRSEVEAKCAAKKIFNNVARLGSKYIYLEDLMRFMREDEALKTMSLFEGATESKRVKKSSLKNWVVNAFRERKALALTLDDTKTAVNQLHHMVNAVVVVLILVIWLLVLGIATTQLLLFISSQLLLLAFMFGNTFKMLFEAIIFLFVMHPFDVGDRCEIDTVQMVVEEMNILTTVFLRYDGQKIIYPNSVLATKPISNFYRSPDMGDAIDFCVHVSTAVEKIALMKQRIIGYIENKPEHWYPAPMVVVRDVDDMNRLKLSVWPQHRMNHQDMGERWVRRAFLVEEMIKIMRELDVEYRMLPLDVNMRHMPPLSTVRLPSNWTACTN